MTVPLGIDAQAIRRRAHELWQKRGCPTGTPELDWLEAERQLRAEAPRAAMSVEGRPPVASARAVDPRGPSQPPRPRAPRALITSSAHAPTARLLAALVPEASSDRPEQPLDRPASRR
jgi:hypothetical protein